MKAFRFIGDSWIQVTQEEPYEAHVVAFYVDAGKRDHHIGSRLMAATCKDADRESVTLYLTAMPFGSYDIETETFYPPTTTFKQLTAFYRSFGFRFQPHSEVMRRIPKGD